MAIQQDEDLDLGAEHVGLSKKKLIIIIAGIVLLLGVGLGIGWYFFGGSDADQDGAEPVEEVQLPAIYHPLDPVFVVNLPPGGKARMLQVGVQVMARDPALIEFLKYNDPMVRHNLLSLFGSQQDANLRDRAGKEKLQAEVLNTINRILKEYDGGGEVEAVYFTSFVMQ